MKKLAIIAIMALVSCKKETPKAVNSEVTYTVRCSECIATFSNSGVIEQYTNVKGQITKKYTNNSGDYLQVIVANKLQTGTVEAKIYVNGSVKKEAKAGQSVEISTTIQ